MATTAIFGTPRRRVTFPAIHDRLLRYFGGTDPRRELQSLSQAQLRDTGIDPAEISNGPVFEADAVAMIRLMSLR